MRLPEKFTNEGVLPPGDYVTTFPELRKSLLVKGTGSKNWDTAWRLELTHRAEKLVCQLWSVGIDDVYLDGSFVEDKDHPNDIDGYFDPKLSAFSQSDMERFEKLQSDLNVIDPHRVWDWSPQSRTHDHETGKKQLPMWHRYRVEFYPHLDQGTGIVDEFGNNLTFPSAFRISRHRFQQKGIVKIVREKMYD